MARTCRPLPLGNIGTPFLPVLLAFSIVLQPLLLFREVLGVLNQDHGVVLGVSKPWERVTFSRRVWWDAIVKIVPALCNANSGDKELRVSQVVDGTRYVAVLVQRMAMIGERARLSGSVSEGLSSGRGRRKVLMSLLVRAENAGTRCHPSLSPGGYSTNVAGAHRIQEIPQASADRQLHHSGIPGPTSHIVKCQAQTPCFDPSLGPL